MQRYELLNLTVSALVLTWMIGLIVRAWFSHDKSSYMIVWTGSGPRLAGAGWAFTLWCAWWLQLIVVYFLLGKAPNLFILLLSNIIGDLMVVGAAIAYCRADAFRLLDLLPLFLLALVIPLLEMTVASVIPTQAGRLVATAPSAVVSTVAMISIGWAVLVRCGWKSAPFFFLMCIYAALQLPAFIYLLALNAALQPDFEGLQVVPYILGFLKIIVGVSFLGYFLSPSHNAELLSKSQAWPSEVNVPMHETYARILKWGAGLIGSLIVGLIIPQLLPDVRRFLEIHFTSGGPT